MPPAVLLFLLLSILPAAGAVPSSYTSGFLPGPDAHSFWIAGGGYRAKFDAGGMHLLTPDGPVTLRFPGGLPRWEQTGAQGPPLHRIGSGSGSLASSLSLEAALSPGVRFRIHASASGLKSEFLLGPGVPPSEARYCMEGARPRPESSGLALRVLPDSGAPSWLWREHSLQAWQTAPSGARLAVPARFLVDGACVGFALPPLDPSLALTIDPEFLFSTYLGGGLFDSVTSLASDAQGNLYAAGWTESADFPLLSPFQSSPGGRIDAFVAKFSPSGQLLFSTFLTGSSEDRANAIVVDSQGNILLAGTTSSTDFPTINAYAGYPAGLRDAFLAKLVSNGSALVFSTCLGGAAHDAALAVAVNSSGTIYIAGQTASANFPTLAARYPTFGGLSDGFVARFSATGTLLSSTFLGGNGEDRATALALGPDGSVFTAGATESTNFPLASARQSFRSGGMDAFYARLDATLSSTLLSSYLGGAGGSVGAEEAAYGIYADSSYRLWICGATSSSDFPGVAGGYQSAYGGGFTDAFLAVVNATSGALEWATYFGGSQVDAATSLSSNGTVLAVGGFSFSPNLPVRNALQPTPAGNYDAFYLTIHKDARIPYTLSYLGGSASDSALAVHLTNSLAIAGVTQSTNFPLLHPLQSANGGFYGGFLTRLGIVAGLSTVSPSSGQGHQQTFVFDMAAASPTAAPVAATIIINSSLSYTGSCALSYDAAANTFRLYDPSSGNWAPLAPGTSGSVSNTLCRLSASGLSASLLGTKLTLRVPLDFTAAFAGTKQIYLDISDSAGLTAGWLAAGAWTATAPPAGLPTVDGPPIAGSGMNQTLTFRFGHSLGYEQLGILNVLINSDLDGNVACYIAYSRPFGILYLVSDAGPAGGLSPPLVLGASGSVANSQCTIFSAGSSASGSGNSFTLTLNIAFTNSFRGNRVIYAAARDQAGYNSFWQTKGVSLIPETSFAYPRVASVSPTSGVTASQLISVTAQDVSTASNLQILWLLTNSALDGRFACYIAYFAPANLLFLVPDNGDGSQAPYVALSGNNFLENSQCRVDSSGSSSLASGNQLTLTLRITFKSPLAGPRAIWSSVRTVSGAQTSPWKVMAAWQPPP